VLADQIIFGDKAIIVLVGLVLYKCDLDILEKCLLSFKYQGIDLCKVNIQIAIIDNDNGSQAEAVQSLAKRNGIPIFFTISSENIGFGAGHNRIFSQALEKIGSFDYYLCVNPDGIPHRNMVENLIRFAASKDAKGLFEAKQFPAEHPKFYDPNDFTTNWCSGCCLLFPRAIYETLCGFDEDFFLYCEDVDISWRNQLAGYSCFTVPDAFFHHYVHHADRDLTQQEIHMTVARYKLALKYNAKEESKLQLVKLKVLASSREIYELSAYKPTAKIQLEKFPAYVDFSHGGYFAENRW
jgi:N-acetylglucosaminyl-diphospho-decaprenol L-rhamnosyltransferase